MEIAALASLAHDDNSPLRSPRALRLLPGHTPVKMSALRHKPLFTTQLRIDTTGPADAPVHNEDTMETNRPGVFIAGTICGDRDTSRWFIENGRVHAKRIAAHLAGLPAPEVEVKGQP